MIAVQQIKTLRLQYHYTQNYLANELNISQKTYSNIESGKTKITLVHLIKLSEIYKMDITQLFGLVNQKKSKTRNEIKKEDTEISRNVLLDDTHLPIELISQFKGRIDDLKLLLEYKDHKIQQLKAEIERFIKQAP